MTTTQTTAAAATWLDTGAVLPPGSAPGDDATDTLTARAYRHPVLGDQVVVRLVPETVGEAEDLTMEFLGFERPQAVAEVGVVRQQALGFPGWVLVHDPANAHHALAVVKELERLARVAKSRIGPARDGFLALGEQLARSVPSFLPSFYEQAARAFLAADSRTYAATMFGKAREAEKSYGLAIDEDRQHTAFLEFALAGALTAKALSAHARDLAERCAPDVAYQRFYRLCRERALGGLPPYATMHTDLRRLAKSARLGPEADERLICDLRAAASVVRAPGSFWAAYRPALTRLARRDPEVSGWLLSIFPKDCPDELWLDILDEAGATAALTGPAGSVAPEAAPPDGPAGWLTRFDAHRTNSCGHRFPALLSLMERMAGRLTADLTPARLCRDRDWVDLDLVDLGLTLGIPLADGSENARYSVESWLEDETEGRRDLAAVAAHEQLRRHVAESAESYLVTSWRDKSQPEPLKVRTLLAVPGLRTVLHWWLGDLADTLVRQGLPGLPGQLDRLTWVACPEGFAVNPEAVSRITGHDLGPVLGRTLRAGVMDEYRWPALETAVTRLGVPGADSADDDDQALVVTTQWPQLVVRVGHQVAVVGREVEHEHLLRIPATTPSWWRTDLQYAGGQLLVAWGAWNSEHSAYWSGAADDVFAVAWEGRADGFANSVALPDGGRTAGDRALHAGDRSVVGRGPVMSDGRTYWTWTNPAGSYGWHEYDPVTGQLGRRSLPAFVEDGAVDGQPLSLGECRLLPAPAELAGSPLGCRGGLVGWRLRKTPDGGCVGQGIDGRSFSLSGAAWGRATRRAGRLLGAVRFPGSDTCYGVIGIHYYRADYYSVCASDGFEIGRCPTSGRPGGFAAGTRLVPPASYWHYLQIRDEAGSAALRACSDELATALLDGAAGRDADAVTALVRELLPQVSDGSLVVGLAGVVRQAAISAGRLGAFGAVLDGQKEQARPAVDPAEAAGAAAGKPVVTVLSALQGLVYCREPGYSPVRLIELADAVLASPEPDLEAARSLPDADPDWLVATALTVLRAAMYRAVCPATPAPHREALLGWLEACAGSSLLTPGGRLRGLLMLPEDGQVPAQAGDVIQAGSRRLLVQSCYKVDNDTNTWALDYAPDGTFGSVPGFRLVRQVAYDTQGVTPEMIRSLVSAARARGPLPWRPELPAALSSAAGLSLAEATAVLAGLPDERAWEESAGADWRGSVPVTDEAADCAHRTWHVEPWSERARAIGLLVPGDPAALWETGPRADQLTAWLTERRGARTPVADDLIITAHRAGIASDLCPSELLHGFANPGTCLWLNGRVGSLADVHVLKSVVRAVPWLADTLPGDHPIRRALPAVLELARGRLADPGTVLDLGYVLLGKVDDLTAALGLPVTSDEHGITAGPVLLCSPGYGSRQVLVHPAGLAGPDDPLLGVLRAWLHDFREQPLAVMRALLSEHLTTWAAYRAPAEIAGAEHDPSRAAPDLVREAAARHRLSEDAATLYLQLLALPDPADRKVAEWTGWKPARLKAARAELAGTDLVVAGKRARAGRSLFLPGGWVANKAPLPAMETWKQPLIIDGITDAAVAVAPVPPLFEVAWQRVRDDDGPRFDDLVLERRR